MVLTKTPGTQYVCKYRVNASMHKAEFNTDLIFGQSYKCEI